MMSCRHIVPLLDAFIDGELSPDKTLDVEQHLTDCETCLEHLKLIDSMRTSLKHAVRRASHPSGEFSARLGAALAAERAREATQTDRKRRTEQLRWTYVGPLAAAATVTLVIGGWFNRNRTDSAEAPLNRDAPAAMTMSAEQLIDELVNYHAAPPEPQITEPSLVKNLEPEVGVPVRLPSLKQYGASWEGGSVVVVRNANRAAVFRYRLSNHPVTIYVYNASRVPLRGALEPRVVHNVPVHVGARRGYSIAALEQRGVGYAVATDLNDDESAELVASIH